MQKNNSLSTKDTLLGVESRVSRKKSRRKRIKSGLFKYLFKVLEFALLIIRLIVAIRDYMKQTHGEGTYLILFLIVCFEE